MRRPCQNHTPQLVPKSLRYPNGASGVELLNPMIALVGAEESAADKTKHNHRTHKFTGYLHRTEQATNDDDPSQTSRRPGHRHPADQSPVTAMVMPGDCTLNNRVAQSGLKQPPMVSDDL
jgi:hypothetical protein